ncbi:MAG TPA: nicotinate-nucleotide adenylyltransferase [Bryobacteraceae bacterium]|nr:nicotinate-nucleotide adenylyltransferase [Bryobacteraceae bacterium]
MSRGLRLALFGGAFDPVHNAHIRIAREAARRFELDEILFVPAARPPHKTLNTPYEDRYRMLELALENEPGFTPSRLEAGPERSYSIDTIEKLLPGMAPDDRLFFIIGADAFSEIESWKRWRDVVASIEFIVVSRPGHEYRAPEGSRVHRLDTVRLPVSSSEIRARLAAGDDNVEAPRRVLEYIRERKLYGAG